MSYQEEPQSLACTPLETSSDYEMDEVFAEEEPQMQLSHGYLRRGPYGRAAKDGRRIHRCANYKKERKRYHPCFEGERTREYPCDKKERTLRVSRSFKEERKRMYHFCKKDWRRPVSRLWKLNEEEYANYVKAEKEGKSFAKEEDGLLSFRTIQPYGTFRRYYEAMYHSKYDFLFRETVLLAAIQVMEQVNPRMLEIISKWVLGSFQGVKTTHRLPNIELLGRGTIKTRHHS